MNFSVYVFLVDRNGFAGDLIPFVAVAAEAGAAHDVADAGG